MKILCNPQRQSSQIKKGGERQRDESNLKQNSICFSFNLRNINYIIELVSNNNFCFA
jgi:hypothetical protein